MKTLGQIAYECWTGDILRHWFMLEQDERADWESAASAVAEECAKIAETAPDLLQNSTFDGVAAAIRSLKTPT